MRVLLAGATGAIGRPLIRCLIQHGHSVFGLVRSAESTRMLTEMGAESVIGDALQAFARACEARSRFKSPSRKLWRLLAPTASITRRACAAPLT